MNADAAVIVFARAPVPGRAKTRLAPRLGEWGAARLHARLTERALATALACACGPVELHATPRATHPFFRRQRRRLGVALREQRGGDLGERMQRALAAALRHRRYAILIGVDAPALCAADLRRALAQLRAGRDVVLAPAEDGGYALIACRRVAPALFQGIAWGGSTVYAQTIERLARLRWRWHALRTVWDVDRPDDLDRLAAEWILTSRAR